MSYGRTISYHRRQMIINKIRSYLYRLSVVVVLIALWCNPYRPQMTEIISDMAGFCMGSLASWTGDNPRGIINHAIPAVAWSNPSMEMPVANGMGTAVLSAFSRVDMHSPKNILQSQIPLLGSIEPPEKESLISVIAPMEILPHEEGEVEVEVEVEGSLEGALEDALTLSEILASTPPSGASVSLPLTVCTSNNININSLNFRRFPVV